MAADNGFPNGCVVSVVFNLFAPIPHKNVEKTFVNCLTDYLEVVITHVHSLLCVNGEEKTRKTSFSKMKQK